MPDEIRQSTLPPLFEFAFCPKFDAKLQILSKLSPESWGYRNTPSIKPLPILWNYIQHTFKRIKEEYDALSLLEKKNTKIYLIGDKCCFNTGLYTENYESIYGLFQKNRNPKQKWALHGFFKESDFVLKEFPEFPERANYVDDISDIIFDWRLPLRIHLDHILDDPENYKRIPSGLREQGKEYIRMVFTGAIELAKKRLAVNFKIAVPQYYNGRVQLLIPLVLNSNGIADLALAIYRQETYYSGRTCLTLDMAYNNARLIVKPESDWLRP